MTVCWRGLHLITLVFLSAFVIKFVTNECLNLDNYIVKDIGLAESQIWNGYAANLRQCMQMCIRLTLCRSLNYNHGNTHCDLNAYTKVEAKLKHDTSLVYSEYDWLPQELDPSCYSRPCEDEELCVPTRTSKSCTKHFCMKSGQKVCPLPPGGTSAGRHVGAKFKPNCPKGFIGHDSAVCVMPGKWSTKLDTTCYPIYKHECDNDTLCSEIGGICSVKMKCECGEHKEYRQESHKCEYDCGSPPKPTNASIISETFTEVIYECENNYVSNVTNDVDNMAQCTENDWILNFECFQCDPPPAIPGATLQGNDDDQVRTYVCDAGLKPHLGTGNGTIRCSPGRIWVPQGFKCHGIRLNNETIRNDAHVAVGYPEIFIDGNWAGISYINWSWQATKVACEEINASFVYGGTFNDNWFNETIEKVYNVQAECTGVESSLIGCSYTYTYGVQSDSAMVITCFKQNFTGSTFVVQFSNNDNQGLLQVIMPGNGTGGICKDTTWGDEEETVACRTIDPQWTVHNSSAGNGDAIGKIIMSNVECSGNEPHLFYCRYRGWGFTDECPDDSYVLIWCS